MKWTFERVALVATLLVAVVASVGWGCESRRRFEVTNALAEADSGRVIATRQGEVAAQLLYQSQVELAGALKAAAKTRGGKAVAAVSMQVVVDTLYLEEEGDPELLNEVWVDTLHFAGRPLEGFVAHELNPLGPTSLWSAQVRPAPVQVQIGVACGPLGAEVFGTAPDWATVSFGKGRLDTRVCSPPTNSKFWKGVLIGLGVALGLEVLR